MARRIYSLVLFQSSAFESINEDDGYGNSGGGAEYLHRKKFVDKCLEVETETKLLRRIFDKAIVIFQGSPLEASYRKQKRDTVVYQ